MQNHQKIIIACFSDISRSQVNRILLDHEINSLPVEKFSDIHKLPKNFIGLINLPLNHGFQTSDFILIKPLRNALLKKVYR
jgi:hypothetical protein